MTDPSFERDERLDRVGRVEDGSVVDAFEVRSSPVPLDEASGAQNGDWVRFRASGGRASVAEEVARAGSARAALWGVAAELELQPFASPDASREALEWGDAPGIDDPSLEDFTHLPFLTIDEPHSRDLDQALFIESGSEGHRVWYAIADAAHFARPTGKGSALFADALARGSTFYLPGLVFPMLPRSLSEGLVSLNPRVERRALVFEVDLDRGGDVRSTRIRRARIRSRCKTSYEAVQRYFDDGMVPEGEPGASDAIARCLDGLLEVGTARRRRAAERDVVQAQRTEISVGIDDYRFVAMSDPRFESERCNEQISLLCNVVGARFLAEGHDDRVQGIFRFHAPPEEAELRGLQRRIDALVRHHARSADGPSIDPDTWRWRRGTESLAEYVARLPGEASEPSLRRLRAALHRQALRSAGRAGFASVPGIHYGVGAEAYARFTAPMREVVGIFVHKECWEKLGLVSPSPRAEDEALRDQVMRTAERSRQLQRRLDRETNRLVLDQLFGDDLLQPAAPGRPATVLGITRSKTHLQLDDPPIDVKVYHRHLADRWGTSVEPGRDGVSLRAGGRHALALGDQVTLRVVGLDRTRDRWELGVDREQGAG